MKKTALFAFQGDPMCFIHVLLNALDLKAKGGDALIVIEGQAVKLVPEMAVEGALLHPLYRKAREQGLIAGVCRACSAKFNVLPAVEAEGLAILDDMSGHAGMSGFLAAGFEIITF
ncbi:MAG: cytoplasmic protein [Pseudomonadota bacterium]